VGAGGQTAVIDPLAGQSPRHGPAPCVSLGEGLGADRAQVGGDLVPQHLLEAGPREGGRVPAVRTRHDGAPRPPPATRAAVARGAAVDEAGADGEHGADVADAVAGQRSLALGARELPLEELPAAADRPEWVTGDDEGRRARGVDVAAAGADLLVERLG